MGPNTASIALKGYISTLSQRGWRDALRNRPYPRAYDEWSEQDQRNYENGRLRAAGAKTLWKYRKDIPRQQTIEVVAQVSASERGFIPPSRDPSVPPEPLPPPPKPTY